MVAKKKTSSVDNINARLSLVVKSGDGFWLAFSLSQLWVSLPQPWEAMMSDARAHTL